MISLKLLIPVLLTLTSFTILIILKTLSKLPKFLESPSAIHEIRLVLSERFYHWYMDFLLERWAEETSQAVEQSKVTTVVFLLFVVSAAMLVVQVRRQWKKDSDRKRKAQKERKARKLKNVREPCKKMTEGFLVDIEEIYSNLKTPKAQTVCDRELISKIQDRSHF